MQKLDVVFTIDENYIQHFCVACTSLLENNKNIGRVFLVQDIEESNLKLKEVINFFNKHYHTQIEKLRLDNRTLKTFKITEHISSATYFRLLLSEVLPSDIDNVLFLDSDLIVTGELSQLVKLDFSIETGASNGYNKSGNCTAHLTNCEYYIYAVNHKIEQNELTRLRETGFMSGSYFNAGIMYINLLKWRKDNMSTTLVANAKKYNEFLVLWDQDVLNITFDGQWGELDFKYNAFGLNEKDNSKELKVIHYTGSSKPWHFRNKHPYKHLYWEYLKKTPFKGYVPEDVTIMNVIKSIIPNRIRDWIKRDREHTEP